MDSDTEFNHIHLWRLANIFYLFQLHMPKLSFFKVKRSFSGGGSSSTCTWWMLLNRSFCMSFKRTRTNDTSSYRKRIKTEWVVRLCKKHKIECTTRNRHEIFGRYKNTDENFSWAYKTYALNWESREVEDGKFHSTRILYCYDWKHNPSHNKDVNET